jgi:hypothetical protein
MPNQMWPNLAIASSRPPMAWACLSTPDPMKTLLDEAPHATAEKVSRAFRTPCPPGLPTRTTTLGSTRSRRAAVEIPDRLAENLVMFIRQNRGTLSKNRRDVEFRTLLNDEVVLTEGIVRDAFEDFNDHGRQLDF